MGRGGTYVSAEVLRQQKRLAMADKIFVSGIKVYKPRDNAPSFVKANLVIDKQALVSFLDEQAGNELRVVLKESQKGSYYLEVDSYQSAGAQPSRPVKDESSDLPF
jgi:hypothetical protein